MRNRSHHWFAFWIAFLCMLLIVPAYATGSKNPQNKNYNKNEVAGKNYSSNENALSARQTTKLQSLNFARSNAESASSASTGASSAQMEVNLAPSMHGGSPTATNEGVTVDSGDYVNISEHTFYSYAQSNRPVVGCFRSGDAAGGRDGKFGAFGLYWLDANCWADKLAADELDVDLNARLKCSGRKYRNAIAYDVKGSRARRDACVNRVKSSGLAKIEQERRAMLAEIDRHKADKATLLDLREHDREVCNESKDRIAEACRK